jgi:hypothetical protein
MAGRKKRSRAYRKAKYEKQKVRTAQNKRLARAKHVKNNPNDKQGAKHNEEKKLSY